MTLNWLWGWQGARRSGGSLLQRNRWPGTRAVHPACFDGLPVNGFSKCVC